MSHLELPAYYESEFFLSIYNEEPSVDPAQLPVIPYATQEEYVEGSQTDKWFDDILAPNTSNLYSAPENLSNARQVAAKIEVAETEDFVRDIEPVSYTHLTLPTICSV